MFKEPFILRPERTDYGKAVRKMYERGLVSESRHNMTSLQPRTDGISNTLTSVLKDNLLLVPSVTDNDKKGSDCMNKIKYEKVPFNYVSLFSGIGGFEQALNKLGGNCVMASEIDKFANQAYEVLYGHKTAGDITKVDAKDVPDHDVLVGGFPCQAFSVAGKRLGFDDTRGTLFFEIARLAAEKKPKLMLLENVKGLISHDKGKTLDTIVQTLNDIGYTVDFDVLNSKYFGVPQNRERIFIVAVRDDLIEVSPWVTGKRTDVVAKGKKRISALAGVKTFNFDWPTQEAVTARLRDILEPEVDEKYYLSEEKTAALVAQLEDKQAEGLAVREATTKGYAVAAEGDAVNFQFPNSKTRRGRVGKQIAQTLEASAINQGVVVSDPIMLGHIDLKGHDAIKRVYSAEGVGPTLTTMGGGHREPKIAETSPKYRIRKLTPKECWRLQGFSDNQFYKAKYYTEQEAKEIIENAKRKGKRDISEDTRIERLSDSQLYKQAGNAVTVNVIEAIGRKLLPLIDEKGGV